MIDSAVGIIAISRVRRRVSFLSHCERADDEVLFVQGAHRNCFAAVNIIHWPFLGGSNAPEKLTLPCRVVVQKAEGE